MKHGDTVEITDLSNYVYIKKQINIMKPISFVHSIKIVLVTDRLFESLKGLTKYFKNSSKIEIDVIKCVEEAERLSRLKSIDFIIIVGMFAETDKYRIIQIIRRLHKFVSVILFAKPTQEAESCTATCDIDLFDETAPLNDLVSFMKSLYEAQTVLVKQEGTTREHAFLSALHNIMADELAEYLKSNNITASERQPIIKPYIIRISHSSFS